MAETVGSLIDKITIVELKIYHMCEQGKRPDATIPHLVKCLNRVSELRQQRDALATELTELAKSPPQPFRQFKMYNDPQYRTT